MLAKVPQPDPTQLELLQRRPPPVEERTMGIEDSMWFGSYADNKFKIKVGEAQNLVADRLFGIGVKACVYLGSERLCNAEQTRFVPPSDNPVWGQTLEFKMKIKDIPRNARLCIVLFGVWSNPIKVRACMLCMCDVCGVLCACVPLIADTVASAARKRHDLWFALRGNRPRRSSGTKTSSRWRG